MRPMPGPHRALSRPPAVCPRRPARVASRRAPRRWCPRRAVGARRRGRAASSSRARNPTGSFKDRGMTCAVSAAVREGARGRHLRVDRQHRGQRRGLRGARRAARRGDRARGQDRHRQARPGADARRARDRAARQLRPGARRSCASWRERHPIALVNSVNAFRIEGQKTAAFEILEELGERSTRCASRSATPGNITAYWRGFQELGRRAAHARLPGRGRGAARDGQAGRAPGDGRQRDPDRQPRALGGGDGRRSTTRAARSARSATSEILDAYRLLAAREGVFCEPASAASVAGLLKYGADGAERVVCVLTGHGLKDPQTALEQAGAVIPCEPDDRRASRRRCSA